MVEWLEWLGYGAESRLKACVRGLEHSQCQPGSEWVSENENLNAHKYKSIKKFNYFFLVQVR